MGASQARRYVRASLCTYQARGARPRTTFPGRGLRERTCCPYRWRRFETRSRTGCCAQYAEESGFGAMTRRCGFAAIIGAPNAGKSTLVNALVGSKVAIVSPKVQTTRMTVRGVALAGETQIVFVDTPGIFKPRRRLDRAMVDAAWAGAEDADAILLVVDAADLTAHDKSLASRDTDAILEGLKNLKWKKAAL